MRYVYIIICALLTPIAGWAIMPPITGTTHVCVGDTVGLYNSVTGGTWSATGTHASVDATTGVVTGISAGTDEITYTDGSAYTTIEVTVQALVYPHISIISDATTPVCEGTMISFAAIITEGGIIPDVNWYLHGSLIATGTGYTYAPAIGDTLVTELISSAECATPDTVYASHVPDLLANVLPTVAVTTLTDTLCAGSTTSFGVATMWGGTAPSYLWTVNNTYVGAGSSYSYMPSNGDDIKCYMISNYQCRTTDTVGSDALAMVVLPQYIPAVSILTSPGPIDTLVAHVVGAGISTPTYQWLLNGLIIPGAVGNSYYNPLLHEADSVCVSVTSTMPCGHITFNCIVYHPTNAVSEINEVVTTLSPNPTYGTLQIAASLPGTSSSYSISIRNMMGRTVYVKNYEVTGSRLQTEIELPEDIADGHYVATVSRGTETRTAHFVMQR